MSVTNIDPPVFPPGHFSMSCDFADARVVIGLRGEVDLLTAADVGAICNSLIDRGHHQLVLDLSHCRFMDASGLRVLVVVAERLDLWGRRVTLRSPSEMVRRLLDLTGLTPFFDLHPSEPVDRRLASDQRFSGSADAAATS